MVDAMVIRGDNLFDSISFGGGDGYECGFDWKLELATVLLAWEWSVMSVP